MKFNQNPKLKSKFNPSDIDQIIPIDNEVDQILKDIKIKFPIKINWSESTITEVVDKFRTKSIIDIFYEYECKIPIRTLNYWKKNPKISKGRKESKKPSSKSQSQFCLIGFYGKDQGLCQFMTLI